MLAACLALALLCGVTAAGAGATVNPKGLEAAADPTPPKIEDPDDIKVVIDDPEVPIRDGNYNKVTRDVVITDRKTGLEPQVRYGVFLVAQLGDDEDTISDPATCLEQAYNSPEIPYGVYRCTIIVDGPGEWTFSATVNKSAPVGEVGPQLGTATKVYNIDQAVELQGDSVGLKFVVEGSNFEVFLLQSHVAAASTWILLSLLMGFLAVPQMRKMLSVLTLHTIEVRRGFLNSALWAMFLVTLGTGIYLLRTQTAYSAPYSISKWNDVTLLPYAQTYFTALYGKIFIFLLMAAATVVLVMEANRRAQVAEDASSLDEEDDDEFWERMKFRDVEAEPNDLEVAGGATDGASAGTALKAKRRVTAKAGVTPRTLWVCLGVVLGGMASIGVCVTLLKYTHELIEQVAALTTLGE